MNQQTAQGLASFGRGPDSMLVHMAPGEVKSLQQLAMAHGGSLTINPETGLPEAGFLSSILPMVLGAGAMMIPGLQGIGAAGIGLGLGGLEALRTGSLKKGLMAGLGAYGGAGLGSALAGAGAQSLATAAVPTVDVGQAMAAGAGDATANLAANATIPTGVAGNFSNMGTGISNLTSGAGRTAFMQNIGGAKGLGMAGLAAAAPMLMETTTKQPEIKTDKDMGQRYQYSPGTTTPTPPPDVPGYGDQGRNFGREQRYFNPRYMPIDNDAARRLYGFASGGPVEDMSNANAIGMNTGYPQADINTGAYATPYQQPISRNMITGAQDAAVNPYTGQAQFAEGGGVDSYTYDPVTQMYTKKAGEGATMVSPTGGISGASAGSGYEQPLNPKVNDYLTWEETTPEGRMARDARMEQVSNVLTLGLPGASIAALVGGRSVNMPDLGVLFGTPQAYTDYQSNFARGMDPMSGPGTIGSRDIHGSNETYSGPSGANPSSDSGRDQGNSGSAPGGGAAAGGLMALAQGGPSHLGDYSDGAPYARGGIAALATGGLDGSMYSQGGITGSGNLDLNIPLNIGGGGSGGGSYGGGGSYPFANSGGAAQPSFTGQNNTAGGGYANPFASSAGAGAPPSGPGMNLDPQGIFSDTFESKNVGVQNMPAAISQLFGVLGGKDQGSTLGSNAMAQGGNPQRQFAVGGITQGGPSHLGDYSDGGRLLRGPGDGISDSIPAMIGKKQPARLADGEFVVPARIVSELGNGSTEAGARKLYAMMDRIQKARGKTVGKGKVAANSRSAKYLPA